MGVPVFICNLCVFLSYHTLLCLCSQTVRLCMCSHDRVSVCVQMKFVCVSMSKVLCMCFLCSRTVPMLISPCTLCVIERTLYLFLSSPTLCVFPVFPYPACLAQQMKQLSGITSLLPQCHPGKNNPMILRLMFTT